jgi:hypothetical protein
MHAWSYKPTPPLHIRGVKFSYVMNVSLLRGAYLSTETNLSYKEGIITIIINVKIVTEC